MLFENIEIVFEDDHILAVNKPNNLIVHQSKFGGRIDEFSLCQLLNNGLKEPVYPIHRLDRKTSGVLLFSKRKELIPSLQQQFEAQTIKKTYLALVRGYVLESGIVDSPIKPEDKTEYKPALSHYFPISSIEVDIPVKPYKKSRYTLIELEPKTGRTHQLRKHMNKISHPIIGDPKYGNRHHNHMFIERLNISNLFLHARSLQFKHPVSNQNMSIEADLPEFWSTLFTHFHWTPFHKPQ